jgi:hypothetical protein
VVIDWISTGVAFYCATPVANPGALDGSEYLGTLMRFVLPTYIRFDCFVGFSTNITPIFLTKNLKSLTFQSNTGSLTYPTFYTL